MSCEPESVKTILNHLPQDDQGTNNPVGGQNPGLPVDPSTTAPGPTDPGLTIDDAPPDFDHMWPRQEGQTFQQFCAQLPSLRLLKGITLNVLYNHFISSKNIIDPVLRQYVWNPDKTQSKIVISVEEDWDPTIIGVKPAVYLTRGDIQFTRVAIGDRVMDKSTTENEYFTLLQGSHILKCYGNQGNMADDLAFEVGTLLLRTSRWIASTLGTVFYRPRVLAAKQRDERDPQDSFFAPVTVDWAIDYRFKERFSSPTINFIDIQAFRT